jgi:hypothetical protein
MTKWKVLGAVAILATTIAAPVFAQGAEGVIGPGSRYGLTPQPDSAYYGQGYYDQGYHDQGRPGFAPFDAAAGIVNGAANTAGAIASAPFRALNGDGSYAMMRSNESYCAQRYRSYDPQSGAFMGYDGRRHICQ